MITFTVRIILSESSRGSCTCTIEMQAENFRDLLDTMSSAGYKNDHYSVLGELSLAEEQQLESSGGWYQD